MKRKTFQQTSFIVAAVLAGVQPIQLFAQTGFKEAVPVEGGRMSGYSHQPLVDDSCRDPNCAQNDEQRRHFLTMRWGRVTEVQRLQLIADIRNVNVLSDDGNDSPLSIAIMMGHKMAVSALLKKGANPLTIDRNGQLSLNHPIRMACKASGEIAPDVLDSFRLTFDSATKGNRIAFPGPAQPDLGSVFRDSGICMPLLKLLMEYGVDPMYSVDSRYRGGYLRDAIYRDRPDALRILVTGKVRPPEADIDRLAYQLALKKKPQLLDALRAGGADPERYVKKTPRLLEDVLQAGHSTEELEFILEAGANPKALTNNQTPVVFLATGNLDNLRLMLKYGADPDARHQPNGYSLLASVQAGPAAMKQELTRLLLDAGANPNGNHAGFGHFGVLGKTKREDTDVIALLISRGATLSETGPRDDRDLSMKLLIPNLPAASPSGPITLALAMERDDIALALIARDKKISSLDRTALSMAARRGSLELVRSLLAAGANPNAADDNGVTAMMAANRRRDERMMKVLADAGAKQSTPAATQRPIISEGSVFAKDAAIIVDDVALFDPPRFGITRVQEQLPLTFFGPDQGNAEQVQCEHEVNFQMAGFISNAQIAIGVCEREAQHVKKLMSESTSAVESFLARISQNIGVQMNVKQHGWNYEKTTMSDGAEVHYAPMLWMGHGVGAVPMVVIIPRSGRVAVVVQANISDLCSNQSMKVQTPLCSGNHKPITDIALGIARRYADKPDW